MDYYHKGNCTEGADRRMMGVNCGHRHTVKVDYFEKKSTVIKGNYLLIKNNQHSQNKILESELILFYNTKKLISLKHM